MKKINTDKTITLDWYDETGDIPFRMTNDYLFRALMQNNNSVLKSLIAALLGWKKSTIKSAVIENPIVLGDSLDSKTYVLDVRVKINKKVTLNLELQVLDAGSWPERSLVYLCRIFDSLNRGSEYADIKPAHHIGILDFKLFPEKPMFHASYQLINKENDQRYTDNFTLSVICLPYIDNATEKDRISHLVEWAAMFKATRWEELRMLAQKNPDIDMAVTSIYSLYQDDNIKEQMIAREEYYAHERYVQKTIKEQKREIRKNEKELIKQASQIKQKDAQIEQDKAQIEQMIKEIAELKAQLAAKG